MSDSHAYILDQLEENNAIGYMMLPDGSLRSNEAFLPVHSLPAGGDYTTVEDLLSFAQALREYRLLNKENTERLITKQVATAVAGIDYGYGFEISAVGNARWFGHRSVWPGADVDFRVYPDLDYTVAVLSNYDAPSARRIADYLGAAATQGNYITDYID
jgi:hypothetical protein